jgi:hypothetical protein
MGITLQAKIIANYGFPDEARWYTVCDVEFGKDHELKMLLAEDENRNRTFDGIPDIAKDHEFSPAADCFQYTTGAGFIELVRFIDEPLEIHRGVEALIQCFQRPIVIIFWRM